MQELDLVRHHTLVESSRSRAATRRTFGDPLSSLARNHLILFANAPHAQGIRGNDRWPRVSIGRDLIISQPYGMLSARSVLFKRWNNLLADEPNLLSQVG